MTDHGRLYINTASTPPTDPWMHPARDADVLGHPAVVGLVAERAKANTALTIAESRICELERELSVADKREAGAELRARIVCIECGHTIEHTDEDGCCLTCGVDTIIVTSEYDAEMLLEQTEPMRATETRV